MSVEEDGLESFSEVVRHVDQSVNAVQNHEVLFNPFAEQEVLDVDVSCAWCWLLNIAHGGTAIIVFVKKGHGFLGYVEVPENASGM
jgi:hypothetical protein